jgi:hypothetical protein
MDLHGRPKSERTETRLLGLHLIELAIAAGWKPRECIEFARDAYEFVMSTLPEAATGRVAGSSELGKEIGQPSEKGLQQQPGRPEWGPDSETRRNALQSLADQNRSLREAAKILNISPSLVAVTARRLKVSFHGHRGRKLRPTASKDIEAPARPANGAAADVVPNGATLKRLPADGPADCRMKRRCPACNQIFEPANLSDYICDDCESSDHAGR